MKKLITLIVTVILSIGCIFGLTACGNDNKITIYTESGFAPFEYVQDNKIVGVDVDIMELVGKKLKMEIEFKNVNFNTIVDAVSEGKLCDVGAAGLSVTAERKEKVVFSTEYYTANLYVIYPVAQESEYVSMTTDGVEGIYWDALAGKKIAVQNGTTADLFLGDELAEDGSIYNTGADKVGFELLSAALNSEEKDVLIIDELPAQMLIAGNSKYSCKPLYYQGVDGEDDEVACDTYAIAVCPNAPAKILNAINEVIAELGETGIQELVNKHLGLTA